MFRPAGAAPRIAKKSVRPVETPMDGEPSAEVVAESGVLVDAASAESPVVDSGGGHQPPKARAPRRVKPVLAAAYLTQLVEDLLALPRSTDWLDIKVSGAAPVEIGESISALANTAALLGKPHGYVVWGINEGTRIAVGTSFVPAGASVNHEELESWLVRHLTPNVAFGFYEVEARGKRIVILRVDPASGRPAQFQGHAFLRIGGRKQPLKDVAGNEQALVRLLDRPAFERTFAAENMTAEGVLARLDHEALSELSNLEDPGSASDTLIAFERESFVARSEGDRWTITHLGAILFARQLSDFPELHDRSVRVVAYMGEGRGKIRHEYTAASGYAVGFAGLMKELAQVLPMRESEHGGAQESAPICPVEAVREVVANALVHQDFTVAGPGPLIEIFKDRVEVSNTGVPLMETDRFLDTAPQSRNEGVAAFMARVGDIEDRGQGIDKVIAEVEAAHLPAPAFEVVKNQTRVVLFAGSSLARMPKADQVHACYLHACLRYVSREPMNITSVRERFAVKAENTVSAARYLNDALEAKVIRLAEPNAAQKLRRYIPYWA
ncbi:MAG: ATP-binding protein [Vicinamibacteria bacterium]